MTSLIPDEFHWILNVKRGLETGSFSSKKTYFERQEAEDDLTTLITTLEKEDWEVASKSCGTYDEIMGRGREEIIE